MEGVRIKEACVFPACVSLCLSTCLSVCASLNVQLTAMCLCSTPHLLVVVMWMVERKKGAGSRDVWLPRGRKATVGRVE